MFGAIPEEAPPETMGGDSDNGDDRTERRIPPRFLRNYHIQEVIHRRQILLVQVVAEYFILGQRYIDLIAAMMHNGASAARYSAEQAQIVQARLPLLLGMGLILAPLTQGLLFAPAAFAYRVLSGKVLVESKE